VRVANRAHDGYRQHECSSADGGFDVRAAGGQPIGIRTPNACNHSRAVPGQLSYWSSRGEAKGEPAGE
jgi:hypothetical protein